MMADGISDRTSLLIGEEGVRILKDSFVVVAGAGAVGGYVLEGLVRAGVGHIRVVDSDASSFFGMLIFPAFCGLERIINHGL